MDADPRSIRSVAVAGIVRIALAGETVIEVHADGQVIAPTVESAGEAGRAFVEAIRGQLAPAAGDERAADLGATAWSQYAVVRPNDGAALGPMPLGQALSLAKEIGGRVMVRRIIHGVWVSYG